MTVLALLSVILISTPMTIIIASVAMVKDPTHCRRYAFMLALGLAVLAYNYYPIGHPDLTRYFVLIQQAKTMSLIEYFDYMEDNFLFVTNTVFWIAGKLDRPHLVPALSTFIVYYVSFYITSDYAVSTNNEHNAWKVMLIQMCCLNYFNIVNNLRNVCAFAIVTLAVYMEVIKKKRSIITLLMYIVACFIHESGAILVLARVLQVVLRRKVTIAVGLILIVPTTLQLLFPYYSFFARYGAIGKLLSTLILTSYRSTISTSQWAEVVMTSSRYLADRYLSITFCIMLLIAIYSLIRQKRENGFYQYLFVMCAMTVSCNVFRTPAYWRFFSASVCCAGPLMILYTSENIFKKMSISIFRVCNWILTGMIWAVHFYMSIGSIDYLDLVSQTFITPLWRIIVEFIVALF